MKSLVLEFSNSSGKIRRSWVRHFEELVVGRGFSSDLVCDFDLHMADRHFQIAVSEMSWVIRLLAPYPAQLFVNGQLITGWEHLLEDGDTIQAGTTSFTVTIEGTVRRQPLADSPPPDLTSAIPDGEIAISWQPHRSCPFCVVLEGQGANISQALRALCGPDFLVATVNHVQLGWTIRDLASQGEDLFASAPEEIRATDSLHLEVISIDEFEQKQSALAAGMKGNAVCLLITSKPLEDLIRDKRSVWAWFARPENLKFHMFHGSEYLRNLILSDLFCVILADDSQEDRYLLFASDQNLDVCRERLEVANLL